MPMPQPTPVAKKASFAAIDTSGQKMTENAAAKTKNMAAIGIEGLRHGISGLLLSGHPNVTQGLRPNGLAFQLRAD
jgi:hypothetical protein